LKLDGNIYLALVEGIKGSKAICSVKDEKLFIELGENDIKEINKLLQQKEVVLLPIDIRTKQVVSNSEIKWNEEHLAELSGINMEDY